MIALSSNGVLTIVEIKSCVADFRADRKWPDYRDFCDRFYFAAPDTMPVEILPEDCGLIVADSFGAAIIRDACHHPLAGRPAQGRDPALRPFGGLRAASAGRSRHAMQDGRL